MLPGRRDRFGQTTRFPLEFDRHAQAIDYSRARSSGIRLQSLFGSDFDTALNPPKFQIPLTEGSSCRSRPLDFSPSFKLTSVPFSQWRESTGEGTAEFCVC